MGDVPDTSSAGDLMRWSFLVLFAKDDVLDDEELDALERITLRDGRIADEEREVLSRILGRIDLASMEPGVVAEVGAFRRRYRIP